MTQPDLFHVAPTDSAMTDRFHAALADGAWHRGKALCAALETDERTIRQIASQSGGAVISGQAGYRLTAHATTLEIDHAENFYRSQARQMLRRAIQVRKARNQRGQAA